MDSCSAPEIWNSHPEAEVQGSTTQEPPSAPSPLPSSGHMFPGSLGRRFRRERLLGLHRNTGADQRKHQQGNHRKESLLVQMSDLLFFFFSSMILALLPDSGKKNERINASKFPRRFSDARPLENLRWIRLLRIGTGARDKKRTAVSQPVFSCREL